MITVVAAQAGAAVKPADFMEICCFGTTADVRKALKEGADVNIADDANNGMTPLMCAAYISQNKDIVRLLIDAGADVNARTETHGWTALMLAAMRNSGSDIVNILINSGADVALRDNGGHNALIYAAGFNRQYSAAADIISALINAGADINAQDDTGRTPLDYADNPDLLYKIGSTLYNSKSMHDPQTAVRWLRKAAARGSKGAERAIDALGVMTGGDFIELCKSATPRDVLYAIRRGAVTDAVNSDGETPLIAAAKYNTAHSDVVTALIRAGLDSDAVVQHRDNDGRTALDYINDPDLLYKIGMVFATTDADGGIIIRSRSRGRAVGSSSSSSNSNNKNKSKYKNVREDQWEAVRWLRKAAKLGHKPARNELARRHIYE